MAEQVASADVILEGSEKNDGTVSHLIEKNGEVTPEAKLTEQQIENRILKTIALYISLAALGLSASLVGSTIVHMEILFDASTRLMSFTFVGHSLGYTLGAWFCGIVYDRTNKEFGFTVAIIVEALATICAAFVPNLATFIAAMSVQGFAMGFIDAASQSYCLRLWLNHRLKEPLLQAAHAFWSLGAAIGPFIIRAFLVELPHSHQTSCGSANSSTDASNLSINLVDVKFNNFTDCDIGNFSMEISDPYAALKSSPDALREIARARFAFVAIGLCMLMSAVLYACLYFYWREPLLECRVRKQKVKKEGESAEAKKLRKRETCLTGLLVVLIFIFYYFYLYIESIPYSFFPTFTIKRLEWSVKDSTTLLALFFGLHCAGRVLAIPLSWLLRPRTLLAINLTLVAVAYVLLLFVIQSQILMWVSAGLAGFGMSSTFASMALWVSETMTISGGIAAVMLVGSSVGAMTGPVIVGQLMDIYSVMWMVYFLVVSGLIHIVIYGFIFVVLRKRARDQKCLKIDAENDVEERLK